MERAVIFLYDAERRMVLPTGSHGVYREFIAHGYGTLEETPIAQRALSGDRVVETTDLENDVPSRYSNLPGGVKLTCTPVAAAGRRPGVIFADRDGEPFALTEVERSTMPALGRTAALASHVRGVTRQLERSRRLSERIDLAREVHASHSVALSTNWASGNTSLADAWPSCRWGSTTTSTSDASSPRLRSWETTSSPSLTA